MIKNLKYLSAIKKFLFYLINLAIIENGFLIFEYFLEIKELQNFNFIL